jgi:hypothetical protein
MATEPTSHASPVCYLDEADDAYRGYATMAEIQQLIQGWIKLAPTSAVADSLTALLSRDLAGTTLAPSVDSSVAIRDAASADNLRDEIRRLLPKIRDDAIHAALKAIADSL